MTTLTAWRNGENVAYVRSVLHPFSYHSAQSADDAAHHLAESGAMPLGGGTDLLVLIAEELARPSALVDLRRVPGSRGIETLPDGGLRIGASTRVNDLARNPLVSSRFPALAQACEAVGTPALRHMGTIGGNLCQRPRCWYFRRAIPCLKNGGESCPAKDGQNQYHAILDAGPCYIVHPSDPAVALTALGATLELAHEAANDSRLATRMLDIEAFYVLPHDRLDQETVLEAGEFVQSIVLPGISAVGSSGAQRYTKLMQRESWDFALASIAAVRRQDGEVRLVLGGVAPRPWRVNSSVEEDVASGGLDDDTIATLAERALYDAKPLAHNGYKVELAATLLRRAIKEIGT
jgi:xanthine dehydrogenase YagS FAD-binding subunit